MARKVILEIDRFDYACDGCPITGDQCNKSVGDTACLREKMTEMLQKGEFIFSDEKVKNITVEEI